MVVENVLIPAHTRGADRRVNREYTRLSDRMKYHRKVGHHGLAAELRKQMQQLPSRDPHDPDYRRLRYVRYADDFVLGFIGPKAEAKEVKESLETFLRDTLKLDWSQWLEAIQGKDSHNPRHQPGGEVPRLRAREPTGQRPTRPHRSA